MFSLTLREENRGLRKSYLYSSFAEILLGAPQGSILGPLLLNAYTSDLFYDIDDLDFASFTDDNTPYSCLSETMSVLG